MRIGPIGHHVTMRLQSSQVLAPTAAARRRAARIFHEVGCNRGLLAFRLADTHAHALVVGPREWTGRLAKLVETRLRWHLELTSPFEAARFTSIETQRHLERAFHYLLRQEEHHGIDLDPMHEASSACDVVGLRTLGTGLAQRTRKLLPRISRDEVLRLMDLEVCQPALDRLADAAAAACALPDLSGLRPDANRARVGAVHAAPELSTGELAVSLGVTRRCIERARRRPADASLVAAIPLQLTLRPRSAEPAYARRDATEVG